MFCTHYNKDCICIYGKLINMFHLESLYSATGQWSPGTNVMSTKGDASRIAISSNVFCFCSLCTFYVPLQLSCHTHKQVLHIICLFCRCFHCSTAFILGNCLCTPEIHFPLVRKVIFIPYNVHKHLLACESVDVIKPMLLQVFKRFPIGDVISYDDPICIMIITVGNGAKTFLTSCVPNL